MAQSRSMQQVQPPGTISYFCGTSAPPGWLKCNGAGVSRVTYSALYKAIGTYFGSGDGYTTFSLPDLRGQFIRAWDDGRGVDSGRIVGSTQLEKFMEHNHQMLWSYYDGGRGSGLVDPVNPYNVTISGETAASTGKTGWGLTFFGGTENRPRNFSLLICIKY